MPILLGIDGTGDAWSPGAERDRQYDIAFANSFVRRICNGKSNAKYIRGPVAGGGGILEAVREGVDFIRERKRIFPNEKILLTGYSRGAAEAVVVAERLNRLMPKIEVEALMMFDCVDRAGDIDAEVIPTNVKFVKHVIRHPVARSRATFGNDGMNYNSPTIYHPIMKYMCTHGGMGGCPWAKPADKKGTDFIDEGAAEAFFSPVRHGPVWSYTTNVTYDQDVNVSKMVWQDVQAFLNAHNF